MSVDPTWWFFAIPDMERYRIAAALARYPWTQGEPTPVSLAPCTLDSLAEEFERHCLGDVLEELVIHDRQEGIGRHLLTMAIANRIPPQLLLLSALPGDCQLAVGKWGLVWCSAAEVQSRAPKTRACLTRVDLDAEPLSHVLRMGNNAIEDVREIARRVTQAWDDAQLRRSGLLALPVCFLP